MKNVWEKQPLCWKPANESCTVSSRAHQNIPKLLVTTEAFHLALQGERQVVENCCHLGVLRT